MLLYYNLYFLILLYVICVCVLLTCIFIITQFISGIIIVMLNWILDLEESARIKKIISNCTKMLCLFICLFICFLKQQDEWWNYRATLLFKLLHSLCMYVVYFFEFMFLYYLDIYFLVFLLLQKISRISLNVGSHIMLCEITKQCNKSFRFYFSCECSKCQN